MTINTKFNIGDIVFVIEQNQIMKFPICDIEYKNNRITYSLEKQKALTMMDKDIIIYREEESTFSSIDELTDYYKNA